ncbi:hypothetical protein C7S14_7277 [Burkholderia cepacia]|nr:hypothetical protein C7S14_7277 [Burkholderia cepacia]
MHCDRPISDFFDSNRAPRHSIEIPFIRIFMTLDTMNSRIAFE